VEPVQHSLFAHWQLIAAGILLAAWNLFLLMMVIYG
jgi:hypothetical protein